jgi:hypothetical protein
MSENNRTYPTIDLGRFQENRCKFPPQDLLPYAGLHIAWDPEGIRILASGESLDELDERLAAMGIHFSQVVHDYVDASQP